MITESTEDKLIRRLKRCTLDELEEKWISFLLNENSPEWDQFETDEDYVLAIKEGDPRTNGWRSILSQGTDFIYMHNWRISELFNELPTDRVMELYWLSKLMRHAIDINLYEVD